MKALGWYWLIGCILSGAALGFGHDKCPRDDLPPAVEVFATVAVWPVLFVAAFSATTPYRSECKRPQ